MQEWSLPDFESKICPPEQLAERLLTLPRPLVFTNGCFDILHRGHVSYLAQAASFATTCFCCPNLCQSLRGRSLM